MRQHWGLQVQHLRLPRQIWTPKQCSNWDELNTKELRRSWNCRGYGEASLASLRICMVCCGNRIQSNIEPRIHWQTGVSDMWQSKLTTNSPAMIFPADGNWPDQHCSPRSVTETGLTGADCTVQTTCMVGILWKFCSRSAAVVVESKRWTTSHLTMLTSHGLLHLLDAVTTHEGPSLGRILVCIVHETIFAKPYQSSQEISFVLGDGLLTYNSGLFV
jgi:hypothetical protein